MTFTAIGYNGSIDEAAWARLTSFMTVDYAIKTKSDFAATTVTGQRQVTISAGSAYGVGVLSTSDADVTLDIKTPSSGQFYLVVLRRNWANNQDSLVVLDGPPTGNVTPTDIPSSQPATINHNPGVVDDQPLWWVWANAVTTDLFLFDVRTLTLQSKLAALEGNRFFGTVQDRDRRFPPPASTSDRLALQQAGIDWVRSDTLWTERYVADGDSKTNPYGSYYAGWYPVDNGPQFALNGAGSKPSIGNSATTSLLAGNRLAAASTFGFPSLDRSAGTFRVPISGYYRVSMGVSFDASSPFQMGITRDGTDLNKNNIFNYSGNDVLGAATQDLLLYASSDYRFELFQRSGASRTLGGVSGAAQQNSVFLSVTWVQRITNTYR